MSSSGLLRTILAIAALAAVLSVLFCPACSESSPAGDVTGQGTESGNDTEVNEATDTGAEETPAPDSGADTGTGDGPAEELEIKPDPPVFTPDKIVMPKSLEADFFTASDGTELPYRLYIPENYSEEYAYPVFVFLHGSGVQGTDNEGQLAFATGFFIPKTLPTYQSIIIIPQCPYEDGWVDVGPWTCDSYSIDEVPIAPGLQAVMELIDYINGKYSTNPGRQYITGMSMGGYGTWDLILRYPDKFTAAVPLCGAGDPTYGFRLKDMALRVYHDADDGAVPVAGSRKMVEAVREAGGENVVYIETTGRGHNVWDLAYRDEEMYEWLFSQRKYPAASAS